jgi:hypothetical protein
MKENELATIVVETAFELHKKIGPGLLEKIYIVLPYKLWIAC